MRLNRLIGILVVLLQKRKTTTKKLAELFEVSTRTILRDLNILAEAKIPIVTTRGNAGGISIMEGYKLNHDTLTQEEIHDIQIALKALDFVSDRSDYEVLLNKLAPKSVVVSPEDSIVIDLASYHKDSLSEKISIIKQAIKENKTIVFDYYYNKGESKREIEPYQIEFYLKAWYVFGWCKQREDFRRFKLNRLWQLSMTENLFNKRVITENEISLNDYLSDKKTVEILFDNSVKYRIIEEYGLNSYQETEKGLLLNVDYDNEEYIIGWILSFGEKATVIGPERIRDTIVKIVNELVNNYQT